MWGGVGHVGVGWGVSCRDGVGGSCRSGEWGGVGHVGVGWVGSYRGGVGMLLRGGVHHTQVE